MKEFVSPTSDLRQRLSRGDALRASWLFLGSPIATEVLSLVGFDFLILDREHSPGGLDTLYQQLRASRVPIVVRVPAADADAIKLALDAGAVGIALSNLSTAEDAERLVKATRYTPHGSRGIQRLSRACQYGLNWSAYKSGIGAAPFVVGLIESRQGLDNLDAIVAVPGLDCIFVGAVDLACDLGHLDALEHADVKKAITLIEAKAVAAGVHLGGLVSDEDDAVKKLARGYRLLTFGSDALYLRDGALAAAHLSEKVTA